MVCIDLNMELAWKKGLEKCYCIGLHSLVYLIALLIIRGLFHCGHLVASSITDSSFEGLMHALTVVGQ